MPSFLPRPPGFPRIFACLLSALLLSSCILKTHPPLAESGEGVPAVVPVVVRVTFGEKPVEGARVEWHREIGGRQGSPASAGSTDGTGSVSFTLPPGRYFVQSQWRNDGEYERPIAAGDRFAYFGGNPVYLADGTERELFLGLEEFRDPPPPVPGEERGTGVSGYVLADGSPVGGAHVFAYLRADTGFRDMGFAASAPSADDGGFLLDLSPGRYFLVVRRRAAGGVAGPMRKGDHFGYYPANPVTVDAGRFTRVIIPATRIRFRNVPAYSADYRAASFIEGRVVDRNGNPVPGLYAALYDNPDLLNRPVFLSDVTGADGRYRLPVPVPGRYFLGARSGYGGSPAPGDLYGRYEGNPQHAVTVRTGDRITGMDIVVLEVW